MRTSENAPSETVWKIAWIVLDRLSVVAQERKMGYFRSVFGTHYTPHQGLCRFSKQFLYARL
jgi:hypothetical protein